MSKKTIFYYALMFTKNLFIIALLLSAVFAMVTWFRWFIVELISGTEPYSGKIFHNRSRKNKYHFDIEYTPHLLNHVVPD